MSIAEPRVADKLQPQADEHRGLNLFAYYGITSPEDEREAEAMDQVVLMTKKRRQSKMSERLTDCQCCGYPISQRHHLMEIASYGESQYTRQLCSNCHELYHIMVRAIEDFDKSKDPRTRNVMLLDKIGRRWGANDARIKYISSLIKLVKQGKAELKAQRQTNEIITIMLGVFSGE